MRALAKFSNAPLLENRTAQAILLLAGMAAHFFWSYAVSTYTFDSTEQISAAVSFLEGHGFSFPNRWHDNLSLFNRINLIEWPQGYSLLVAILVKLTGNLFASTLFLDLFSGLIFLWAWLSIFRRFTSYVSEFALLGIWLFWAIFFSPLWTGGQSDSISMALFSLAVALSLRLSEPSSPKLILGLATGLLMGLTSLLRYAYYPLLPVLLVLMVFWGYWKRDRRFFYAAAIHCGAIFLVLVPSFIEMHSRSSALIGYYKVSTTHERGFWINHLLYFSPFVGEYLRLDILLNLCSQFSHACVSREGLLAWTLTLSVGGLAFIGGRKLLSFGNESTWVSLFGMVSFLFLVGALSYLTLTYQPTYQKHWYHSSEARYFMPLIPFLLLLAAQGAAMLPSAAQKGIAVAFLTLTFGACLKEAWILKKFIDTQGCYQPQSIACRSKQGYGLLWKGILEQTEHSEKAVYVDDDEERQSISLMAGARPISVSQFLKNRSGLSRDAKVLFFRSLRSPASLPPGVAEGSLTLAHSKHWELRSLQ